MSNHNHLNDNDDDHASVSRNRSMFEEDEEDVVYRTEDGFEIPPEWQTSCLMMLDLQHQLALEVERKKKNPPDESPTKPEVLVADNDNSSSKVDVTQLFANLERLTNEAAAEMLAEQKQEKQDEQERERQHDDDEEEEEQEYYENDWENDTQMHDGMMRSESVFEREMTEPDQWKLEEIIMRKSVPVADDDIDDNLEDDDIAEGIGRSVTKKKKQHREFSYLCKWAPNGRYTTWELRSLLVEQGFKPQVDSYDQKILEKGKTEKQPRYNFKGPCKYKSKVGQVRTEKEPPKKVYPLPPITLKPLAEHQLFFEKLFPNALETVRSSFENITGVTIVRKIINIAPEGPARNLMESMRHHPNWKTRLLFHGTSPAAVAPIMRDGLLFPGKDGNTLSVANGSAYGLALYTAIFPSVSLNYCKGGLRMFVCVGFDESFSRATTDFRTFADEKHVCPVWLVEFEALPSSSHNLAAYSSFPAILAIKNEMRNVPKYRYYDFQEFAAPLPNPDPFHDLAGDMLRAHQQSNASAVITNLTGKEKKKFARMRQRVLNIRSGVSIEKA